MFYLNSISNGDHYYHTYFDRQNILFPYNPSFPPPHHPNCSYICRKKPITLYSIMDGDKVKMVAPENDGKSLRTSAFMAITFSTVAVASCLVTFPLLFHYVLQLEATAQTELEWCYVSSLFIWFA